MCFGKKAQYKCYLLPIQVSNLGHVITSPWTRWVFLISWHHTVYETENYRDQILEPQCDVSTAEDLPPHSMTITF